MQPISESWPAQNVFFLNFFLWWTFVPSLLHSSGLPKGVLRTLADRADVIAADHRVCIARLPETPLPPNADSSVRKSTDGVVADGRPVCCLHQNTAPL